MKTSTRVICRNEVFIEGVSVGPFESFRFSSDRRTFGATGVLTLPLYAMSSINVSSNYSLRGEDETNRARRSVRRAFKQNTIKPCAQVEVWCWYEGYERTLVFSGFVSHVVEGFPSELHLSDNTFILRFGEIQKGWNGDTTVQDVIRECLPIANAGFKEERQRQGFEREVTALYYSDNEHNVQAHTTPFTTSNFGGRSPFDVLQRVMSHLVLYGGVNNDFGVFMGAGVSDSTRPVVKLDTRYNVFARDITPVDGRFVDYDVKVVGILKSGKNYTATGGLKTSRTGASQSEFENTYGEKIRIASELDTVEGLQTFADSMLNMLKGFRNKGTLQLILYPKVEVMDVVQYTDSLFQELTRQYYVIEYEFTASDKGYYQTLSVTDQVYMI